MNRILLVALVTLLAAPMLSGCLGGDEKVKTDDPTGCGEVCEKQEVDDTTGCIIGTVQSDSFVPIQGAEVRLRELDVTDITDEKGAFSFCGLEPGVYNVYAAAAGHEAASKEVTVVAAEQAPGDIQLVELPPAAEPFATDPVPYGGFMGCAIAREGSFRGDFCSNLREAARVGSQYPLRDPNQRNHFYPILDAGISAFAVGIDADPPPPGSTPATLTYRIWWDNPPTCFADVVGQDGHSEVVVPEPGQPCLDEPRGVDRKNDDGTTTPTDPAHVIVELAQMGDVQFTAQHKFTLWLAFFYNGYEVPADYSALPDV